MKAAHERLRDLEPGRHYGASTDSGCWVMVGRNLTDVTDWSIIPPEASLTLNWGAGGCMVEFGGGRLSLNPGDCMWIDRGLAHRGSNLPGSDFLTVFMPDRFISGGPLELQAIGAASRPAPAPLAELLIGLAGLLLSGEASLTTEAPMLEAILDWATTHFEGRRLADGDREPVLRAASLLRACSGEAITIASVARSVGLGRSELSRRFTAYHRVTPELYRKQVRLARATRALAQGYSVLKAAHEAGFSDTAHLSRTFRQQYGITPSTWARGFTRMVSGIP